MALAQALRTVCERFLPARALLAVEVTELRRLVEVEACSSISALASDKIYKVRGHVQQGTVADVPRIGVHDRRIDASPQTGVYVALLFKVDGSGMVLSLQHGTEGRSLRDIRAQTHSLANGINLPNQSFMKGDIRLRPAGRELAASSRPGKYEQASLVARQYDCTSLTDVIETDLLDLLRVYRQWVSPVIADDSEDVYQGATQVPPPLALASTSPGPRLPRSAMRPGSLHPPRDPLEGESALAQANWRCEVNPDHETFETSAGRQYMEKHHLIPMHQYFTFDVTIDHQSNIVSLCPLCHRMVHLGTKERRRALVRQLAAKREAMLSSFYGVTAEQICELY